MRITLALAALAVGAIAAPHQHKRDLQVVVETVTDIVYVYDIVTVTADDGFVSSSTILAITSTSVPAASILNHNYDTPSDLPSSEPIFSILPIPIPSTRAADPPPPPPPAPTVVMSPTSTSIAAATTSVAPPIIFPPPAASPATSQAEPVAPVAPASTNRKSTGYNDIALAHHNVHRQNHSAPDLVWDDALAKTAERIASKCIYEHNTKMDRDEIGGYGQNIAAGVDSTNISTIITELFYNGEVNWYERLYDQDQPDMTNFEDWGHFSQIVWRDTTKVGCSTWNCVNGLANVGKNVPPHFTVCNYQGPGNVANQYKKVGRSLGRPTVHWNYGL